MVKEYKEEREWAATERREKRMDTWQSFQKVGKKRKTVGAGWKGEVRVWNTTVIFGKCGTYLYVHCFQETENHDSMAQMDDYKKKWK